MKTSSPIHYALLFCFCLGAAIPCLAAYDSGTENMGLSQLVQTPSKRSSAPITSEIVTIITGEWVDVREILKFVAKSNGYSLQIAPDVDGLANVHLENVNIHEALKAILEPIGLGYELVDRQMLIYKHGLATRWFDFDYMVIQRKGQGVLQISGRGRSKGGGNDQNESQITSSSEMNIWPEIVGALKVLVFGASGDGGNSDEDEFSVSMADNMGRSLVISPMGGLIQATAEWNRLRRVEVYLARMHEALRRQVAIEVQILEVSMNDGLSTGIDWNAWYTANNGNNGTAELSTAGGLIGAAEPFFRFVINGKSVAGLLEMIEEQGEVNVVSTPRITTLNNQKAVVRVITEEVYYEAQVEPAFVGTNGGTEPVVVYVPTVVPIGLVLDVTPQVGHDDVITLNVHPTITDVVGVALSPNLDSTPVVSVRELDTVGKVRDGQTLVVAGLIYHGFKDTTKGVPLLARIPILGHFFKRHVRTETKTELVMLLTPVIMNDARIKSWSSQALQSVSEKMD